MGKLKWLLLFIVFLAVATAAGWFAFPFFRATNALLQVNTPDVKSKIYLDGKLLGETPFLGKNLRVGDHTLRLEAEITKPTAKKVEFSTPITLTSQALTAINYDFGPNDKFSSGDIRTFREGSGLSVVTNPSGAAVWLDGKQVGKSPFTLEPTQGVHKLKITQDGFVTRELTINIERDSRLVAEVFLAQNPSDKVSQIENGQFQVYSVLTSQKSLLADPAAWSEGVFFFAKDLGVSFDCLIDSAGKVYYENKTAFEEKVKGGKPTTVGYLTAAASPDLTADAKTSLNSLTGQTGQVAPAQTTAQVQILATPTGTLNVRSSPNTSSSIVTKVNPGETYQLLEETTGWYKIKLTSQEGWISSQYAKKI